MFEVKVLDVSKKIMYIKWSGMVEPEEVREATNRITELLKGFPSSGFDVLVEMVDVTVMKQDTREELVKHQEWLKEAGMKRAAVVVEGAVAKMQLKRTAKQSNHSEEYHFNSYDEAFHFLKDEAKVHI
ncbi:STAS/SEC14 domain-containing protein [Evansella cellulosilytica]|uniref:STAS/SEC14 domain-containing protein n=1 Tax=Evansella cellulosilytica (strain ATCC 21833 / DSM 2522 / FERM P-1141 / JCM 9156 / N-4) TaxID=649639 RepID=E6U1C5_EVAC2|nr:STAS/SEC14 domain-containing protein [Evansella cellulosilytica]ADU29172.1 hypothetical protein Bcell_0896 [Evansella cellulosilytica DSM 2522]